MARRERTTGLPPPRRRERAHVEPRIAGIPWGDRQQHFAIFGGALALALFIVALVGYRVYDSQIGRPNSVILQVGSEDFTLRYYTDRLVAFIQANSQTSVGLNEQALLSKLEEEGVTNLIGRDRGITISDDEITAAIAQKLNVPVGGSGSSFDTLYRQELKKQKIDDSTYRREIAAETLDTRLKGIFTKDVGDSGELFTIRTVVVDDKDKADAVLKRVQSGENLGTIAQTDSSNVESRSQDGLLQPEAAPLLPANVRTAIKDQAEGTLLGPIEVDGKFWVARLEKRDPAGRYTDGQKSQLGDLKLADARTAKRSQVKIVRSLDGDDIKWAEKHAR